MAEPEAGSKVAHDLGIPLGQLYSWVKRGLVKQLKEDGWPNGKGLLVDPTEAKLAWAQSKKKGPRAPRAAREPKVKVRNEAGELVTAPPASKKLKVGSIVSFSGQHAKGSFDPRKAPKYTVAQVLGSNGLLTYLDDGNHRVQYGGVQLDNIIFTTDRLSLMMAKGAARIEKPLFVLGMVILSLVVDGQIELAESLENWMVENGLDVIVPELVDLPLDEGGEAEQLGPVATVDDALAGDDDE